MELRPEAPIGIFDSGLGGLAVLQQVRRLLPHEEIVFLGDTLRQPYGPRPVEEVRRFALEMTAYLARQGVKMVIIACNSATVAGGEAAQHCFPDLPVLGMIAPGVRAALSASQSNRIGIWGTAITIASKAYDQLILQLKADVHVLGVACPQLLRLAEKGQIDDKPYLRELARRYFQPLADFKVDTLILGCTDLTCVRDIIDEVVPGKVTVVDPADQVVHEAQQILEQAGGFRLPGEEPASYQFLITGDGLADFAAFASRFLGMPKTDVGRVALAEAQQAMTGSSQECMDYI